MKKNLTLAVLLVLIGVKLSAQNQINSKDANSSGVTNQTIEHRIIFQLTSADTLSHKALMKQLTNITTVSPTTKIEVVCHGPGLDMLISNKTVVLNGIKNARKKGVVFFACEFSIKERKIDRVEIIEDAGFVPAGIIEVVKKQEEGWSYIKSGF